MHGLRADPRWRKILTPRWLVAHGALLVFVVACLLLGRWQIGRAADGNLLSYGYAIQWPAFAAFAVWVWIAEVRKALRQSGDGAATAADVTAADVTAADVRSEPDAPDLTVRSQPPPSRPRRPRSEVAYDDSDDPELAAYNHYLAWRNAHPHATIADYPGPPSSKELAS